MKNKVKLFRGILSTTHVDSHGDQLSVELLKKMCNSINSKTALRWGLDHNRLFPPLGRVENGSVTPQGEYFYLEGDYKPYDHEEEISWDKTLLIETFNDSRRFIEIEEESPEETIISVDRNCFPKEGFERFFREIDDLKFPIHFSEHIRKAKAPTPELIFVLGKTALLYQMLKPIAKKVGEKILDKATDQLIDQGKFFYNFIRKSLAAAFHHGIYPGESMVVIFQINEVPNIELVAKTNDEDLILKGLKKERVEKLLSDIEFYQAKFNVDKIQFVLNEKGKWKFSYLLTLEGASVGKKEIFKKRDSRFERLLKLNGGVFYNSPGLNGNRDFDDKV